MSLKQFIVDKKLSETHFIHNGIEIMVKDPLPDTINIKKVISHITSIVPKKLIKGVKGINVGAYSELQRRKIQAVFS